VADRATTARARDQDSSRSRSPVSPVARTWAPLAARLVRARTRSAASRREAPSREEEKGLPRGDDGTTGGGRGREEKTKKKKTRGEGEEGEEKKKKKKKKTTNSSSSLARGSRTERPRKKRSRGERRRRPPRPPRPRRPTRRRRRPCVSGRCEGVSREGVSREGVSREGVSRVCLSSLSLLREFFEFSTGSSRPALPGGKKKEKKVDRQKERVRVRVVGGGKGSFGHRSVGPSFAAGNAANQTKKRLHYANRQPGLETPARRHRGRVVKAVD